MKFKYIIIHYAEMRSLRYFVPAFLAGHFGRPEIALKGNNRIFFEKSENKI